MIRENKINGFYRLFTVLLVIVMNGLSQGDDTDYTDNAGTIIRHEANQNTRYTWFSYVPINLEMDEPAYILIGNLQYPGVCDANVRASYVRSEVQEEIPWSEKYRFVLLHPAIPYNCNIKWDPWVRHFPKYVFTNSPNSKFYRPDLRVNAMIDALNYQLSSAGYNIQPKIFLIGFSVGGHFSNRYALIQPARVKAFTAGGLSGKLTLPENKHEGIPMKWDMGISNYKSLVGKPFRRDLFKQIPMFIFTGEKDFDNYWLWSGCYNGWAPDHCHWLEVWGKDIPTALRNQSNFLNDLGYKITFKIYPDVGHVYNDQMRTDEFEFLHQYR